MPAIGKQKLEKQNSPISRSTRTRTEKTSASKQVGKPIHSLKSGATVARSESFLKTRLDLMSSLRQSLGFTKS